MTTDQVIEVLNSVIDRLESSGYAFDDADCIVRDLEGVVYVLQGGQV